MASFLGQTSALTPLFILSNLVALTISQALVDGQCTLVKLLAVRYDKSLDDHVLTSYPVEKEDDCQLKCFMHKMCVSYNLGPVLENGVRDCEISKSDEFRDPQNMTDRPGYFYRGIENSCSSDPCPSNASCVPNFESLDSFQCLCPSGFTGDTCATDVDECQENSDNCHLHASCNNTVGSFDCVCNEGFSGNGRFCADIDECEVGQSCHGNGECINTAGSFYCKCKPGYTGDGVTRCKDADECTDQTHNCDFHAQCLNTEGSFKCGCNTGYNGNGTVCTDINECDIGSHNCHLHETCSNTAGSFSCSCNPGFLEIGVHKCTDIDECKSLTHRCHAQASCLNTIGSYHCSCIQPYQGDGFTCQEPPSFTSEPMSIIVEEQEDVIFTCTARGDPMPHITWSKENGLLPVGRFVVGLGSLSLSNVLRNDSGNYTCNATSAAGTILSSAELLVHSILKFTMESSGPFDIFTGDSLALPCSAESDPEPTMTWKFPNVSGVHIFVNNTLFIASAELSHTGMYMCQAENYFRILQQYINVHVYAYPSCHHIKTQQRLSSGGSTQADTSGVYFIDPDGGDTGEAPFEVFCNMTMNQGNGGTLVSHDSEARTLVDGHGPAGSYRRDVHYTGATLFQIVSLMSVSKSCRQFIKYECLRSALLKDATGYWVSREGAIMQYWGGATPGSGMCACREDRSCVSSGVKCNCDSEAGRWLEDSGFLKDTSTLPVTQLRFGDTDSKNEQGYHTLGKLECHGRVEDSTDGTGM